MQRKKLGYLGEDMAREFLENSGYKIICKNYTVRGGEIDIIAKDGNTLVFAEVKTRKNDLFGKASEAVNSKKISHMCTAARRFIHEHKELKYSSVRFDVLEVYTQKAVINHIVNIDIN
ncbi:MAG: YraN family protein [Ruminococcaceae bacterium]|nr:YraN family protein [Oscillospiraceae bacterium]